MHVNRLSSSVAAGDRSTSLYCLADTPPAVSEFSPESLDRDNLNNLE